MKTQWLAFRQADGCLAPSVLDVRHMKVVEMSHMKRTALNRIKCVCMYTSYVNAANSLLIILPSHTLSSVGIISHIIKLGYAGWIFRYKMKDLSNINSWCRLTYLPFTSAPVLGRPVFLLKLILIVDRTGGCTLFNKKQLQKH